MCVVLCRCHKSPCWVATDATEGMVGGGWRQEGVRVRVCERGQGNVLKWRGVGDRGGAKWTRGGGAYMEDKAQ